ncbi:MAG: FHA domain-containing protein [Anaerolineales bacterium]|nr:FHA domain-containing protein [Anaerolineales bacterium]
MSAVIMLVLRALTAVALYAFLGYALILLWQDLNQRNSLLTRVAPSLAIQIHAQPNSQQRRFSGPQITIGRDLACDLHLPSETVSGQHARLSYHNEQWWLEDLGSTNGTFLNQEAVHTPTVIVPGDQVRCGEVSFSISAEVQLT